MTELTPDWALPWFALAAVAALAAGALRLSLGLAMVPLAKLVIVPAMWPLVESLPLWVVLPLATFLVLLTVHRAIALVFGPEAAGQFTGGVLLAVGGQVCRVLFGGVFRVCGTIVRRLSARKFLGAK